MARLFIAVWPTADVMEELRRLPRKDRPGLRWVAPENWHVTLRFLGDADADEVAARLDPITLHPATARYGPAVDVLRHHAIVVPVHGLDELAHEVTRATRDLGVAPPRRRFSGHLTLARPKPRSRIPAVIGSSFRAEQVVYEVALVASSLHPDGARYETVSTWPLDRPLP